jgi:hypothetical protein
MSDLSTRTKRDVRHGELFPDRATMIIYLEYALDELAEIDEISASLIQMAITNLRGGDPRQPVPNYKHKLS